MDQFASTWAPLLYLASGILFILALRGLSSPATSRKGNRNGMIGMTIAVGTTLALYWTAIDLSTWGILAAGVLVGGGVGAVIARKIPMTDMPQLVAAFHSLVGLAAVLVAAAALYAPDSFGIGTIGQLNTASLIELALGSAIGALTFTGSVIAFAKLNGNMSGAPILLPARHLLNIAIGAGIIALITQAIAGDFSSAAGDVAMVRVRHPGMQTPAGATKPSGLDLIATPSNAVHALIEFKTRDDAARAAETLNDDKEGKPVGIHKFIGRRPIAAFGNSDGDFQMLEWTTAGEGARLGARIHHTDVERKWPYDRD